MEPDVLRYIGAVTREVESREHDGRPARVVMATCSYGTTLEDLWDAIANPDRIPRWFLPISDDLRVGGRYQLQGNAGGEITVCDPPRSLAVTWEFGGQLSWVRVRRAFTPPKRQRGQNPRMASSSCGAAAKSGAALPSHPARPKTPRAKQRTAPQSFMAAKAKEAAIHAFDVLGDPVRRRILELLATSEQTAGALVQAVEKEFGISQAAVSQHLKVLRQNGFATVRVDGARRVYAVTTAPLQQVDAWLDQFRGFWEQRLKALTGEIARGKHERRRLTEPRT